MRSSFGGLITANVSEKWYDEIRAGRAFMKGQTVPAVPAQVSAGQLLNPSGSNKTALLRRMTAVANVAGIVEVYLCTGSIGGSGFLGVNLRYGGAASVAEHHASNNIPGIGDRIAIDYIAANTPRDLAPEWWAELGPNEGVYIVTQAVNVALQTMHQWVEV